MNKNANNLKEMEQAIAEVRKYCYYKAKKVVNAKAKQNYISIMLEGIVENFPYSMFLTEDGKVNTEFIDFYIKDCNAQYRQNKRHGTPLSIEAMQKNGQEPFAPTTESVEDIFEREQKEAALDKAIAALEDEGDRQIILRLLNGKGQQEIADALGLSQSTISYRKKRIMKRLSEAMKK